MDDSAIGALTEVENQIADMCAEDNDHFSPMRFHAACSAWSDGGGLVDAMKYELSGNIIS
jgi:hypothetical protein